MIDIENEVFDYMKKGLLAYRDDIYVTSLYYNIPQRFPCVFIEEYQNNITQSTIDSSGEEKYSSVVYDVNVYSNKQNGRKTEAKDIAKKADELMRSLGFTRFFTGPVVNYDDTVYRYTMRYSATVSQNKVIYR